jgi:DNA (cytosine-5)-methyltransferase 1
MKYFSTFSGIGGFELGIIKAYDNRSMGSEKTRDQRMGDTVGPRISSNIESSRFEPQRSVCVGYSEIDKYASAIYQHHFPEHNNYGDITKINADKLPDFDLLVGGFPCQAFSIAGERKGFDDTRGTLFFELARILRAKQPRLFVFENVKGLLSHDGGKSFATIIQTLDELGYDLQWQVLNSKNHGVPQNRERIIIVGHLRGTPRPKVFPFGHDSQAADGVSGQHSNTLTTRYYGGQANGTYVIESELDAQIEQLNQPTHSNDRVYGADGISPTLNTMQGGMRQPFVAVEQIKIRRLTPTECERLQGFPDGWTAVANTSDTQRYKTLGNAVTTNVIRDVMERVFLLDELIEKPLEKLLV